MTTKTLEGFSISHAAILNGTTGADLQDIYGIRSGSLDLAVDNYDNTGDDSVLSTWYWFNYATVAVQSGYVPFDMIQALAGTTVTSSGSGTSDYYSMPLWTDSSTNQAPKPLLLRMAAKDSAGQPRTMDIVLYKVQFSVPSFDGPSYKNGLILNYSGRALKSNLDEVGNVLAEPTIGRLISRPVGTTNRF